MTCRRAVAPLAAAAALVGATSAATPASGAGIRAYPGSTSGGHVAEVVLSARRVDWFVQARLTCQDGSVRNETFQTDRSDHVVLRRHGRFSQRVATRSTGGALVRARISGTLHSRSGEGKFSATLRTASGQTCSSGRLRLHLRYRPSVHSYWLS